MNIRLGLPALAWATLCFFPAHGGPAPSSFSGRQAAAFLTPPVIEEGLLDSLNRERERNGCPPLRPLPALADVARVHSRKMAAAARLFHVSESEEPLNDRLVAAGLYFAKTGENVARSDSFLPAFIHQALLESPPHRENMLDPDFDAAGVGVVSVDNRVFYVSQIFVQSIRILDEDEAAAELKRQVNEIRRTAALPPLVFWEEADRFAENMVFLRRRAAAAPEPPARFGAVSGYYFESTSLSLPEAAVSEIARTAYTHAGLGVDFMRTKTNPGGAYILALILMSENELNRPAQELERTALRAINAKRLALGRPGIDLSPALTEEARRAASALNGEAEKKRPAPPPESGFRIMTYVTFDPADLPVEVERHVLTAELRFIGIQAAFRRTKEYPLGVIRVILVIGDS
ncbi:MAG: CAP domain-containing protein [Candidatus Aminicenantes bacterium]|nr:CAP domain-containing protein [Candidatus Aminicenantes bacterium]